MSGFREVITIDPWANRSEDALTARAALAPFAHRVTVMQMSGVQAAGRLAERAFDLVFIDSGQHRDVDVTAFRSKARKACDANIKRPLDVGHRAGFVQISYLAI